MAVVKELPALERPREKAHRYGLETLSDIELLAILLSKGYSGANAIEISSTLLNKYGGLKNLSEVSIAEFKTNKGIKDAKSLILGSIFEIHRRLITKSIQEEEQIANEDYLVKKYYPTLSRLNQEQFILVLLNYKHEIIYETTLYKGTENMINVSFNDIQRIIFTHNAKSYYLIHNHVSGDSEPSNYDVIATDNIAYKSNNIGIKLVDHLIIAQNDYYSFSKKKKTTISY